MLQAAVAESAKVTDNEHLLEKVLDLLKPEKDTYESLPDFVQLALRQGLEQVENGETLTAAEAEGEYLKWLSENE